MAAEAGTFETGPKDVPQPVKAIWLVLILGMVICYPAALGLQVMSEDHHIYLMFTFLACLIAHCVLMLRYRMTSKRKLTPPMRAFLAISMGTFCLPFIVLISVLCTSIEMPVIMVITLTTAGTAGLAIGNSLIVMRLLKLNPLQ